MLVLVERAVVQIRGISRHVRCAGSIQLNKLHLARDHAAITGAVGASILNGVLQIHQRPRLFARIVGIYQHRPSLEEIPVALQHEINSGVEEGMAGAEEDSKRLAGHRDQRFLEGDTLIAWQHRLTRADLAVTGANDSGYVGDLIPSSFTHAHTPT